MRLIWQLEGYLGHWKHGYWTYAIAKLRIAVHVMHMTEW
jgi:hypothetical protein